MYMAPGMDDGDIISQKEVEITNTDTASTLHDKLSKLGSIEWEKTKWNSEW